jgi:CRP-like cAMP-binding protein
VKKVLHILGLLTDQDADWLVANGRQQRIAVGEVVIQQGQPIQSIFIVLDGALSVDVGGGKEIARLRCGEIVGELSFLDSRPPSATIRAAEASLVLSIPRPKLEKRLHVDQAFAARFYHALGCFLAHRLRSTMAQLGFKGPLRDDAEYEDELDPSALDRIEIAAARFEAMLRRLRAG